MTITSIELEVDDFLFKYNGHNHIFIYDAHSDHVSILDSINVFDYYEGKYPEPTPSMMIKEVQDYLFDVDHDVRERALITTHTLEKSDYHNGTKFTTEAWLVELGQVHRAF